MWWPRLSSPFRIHVDPFARLTGLGAAMAKLADRPIKTRTRQTTTCTPQQTIPTFRLIFRRAYRDVKNMLEANLLLRFLNTDRFKNVRMQRENMKAMMDSPPLQAGKELVRHEDT